MKAEQRKKLEEQLRKLMAQAKAPQEEKPSRQTIPGTVRVIRRRRGQPDMLIA
jgi:hypothetical protein